VKDTEKLNFEPQMNKEKIEEMLASANPKALRLEPNATFDRAVLGLSSDGRIVYSESKILLALQDVDGMDYDEALEWYEFNTARGIAYAGRYAPIIVTQEP
jgi:hypothetical protein